MIYLKKGKFYTQENVEIPLEFGNREQINILKYQNQRLTELLNDGEELYILFETEDEEDELNEYGTLSVNWRCIKCSKLLDIEFYDVEEDDTILFNNEEKECGCGTNYIIKKEVSNNLILKIKNDKKANIKTGKLFN